VRGGREQAVTSAVEGRAHPPDNFTPISFPLTAYCETRFAFENIIVNQQDRDQKSLPDI
jgi:hypothetical protein